jgi:hypothetical protein
MFPRVPHLRRYQADDSGKEDEVYDDDEKWEGHTVPTIIST